MVKLVWYFTGLVRFGDLLKFVRACIPVHPPADADRPSDADKMKPATYWYGVLHRKKMLRFTGDAPTAVVWTLVSTVGNRFKTR